MKGKGMFRVSWILLLLLAMLLAACDDLGSPIGGSSNGGETAQVTTVIDGDTIDVLLNGEEVRVRYVGVNTPERDEVCYSEAMEANRAMVEGQTVRMVKDTSETDRYGRLLRYIYVGNTFVNEQLVAQGYAEVVLYEPDDRYFEDFLRFESNATRNGLGCHPTGIFNDNSSTR
jgi:endonuclease YncB( thermonuclease family)